MKGILIRIGATNTNHEMSRNEPRMEPNMNTNQYGSLNCNFVWFQITVEPFSIKLSSPQGSPVSSPENNQEGTEEIAKFCNILLYRKLKRKFLIIFGGGHIVQCDAKISACLLTMITLL